MPAEQKFRLPASVILLDLVGTLLILAGAFDLVKAPLPGPVSQLTAGYGWPLVIGGGVAMMLGAGVLVSSLLASQRTRSTTPLTPTIRTVDRRAR